MSVIPIIEGPLLHPLKFESESVITKRLLTSAPEEVQKDPEREDVHWISYEMITRDPNQVKWS